MTLSTAAWIPLPYDNGLRYTKGRNRPVQFVVIHCTQGSETRTAAEDGRAYDGRRTDGTSTHLLVDPDSVIREVADTDRAHHARYHGNEIGLGIELCARAEQTPEQWADADSAAMLENAAREVAQLCIDHGLPPRRLSVAETRAAYYAPAGHRPFGIVGHVDVTNAFPEDEGTHWDPGTDFPWLPFLAKVARYMIGPAPVGEESSMRFRFSTTVGGDGRTVYITDGVHYRRVPLSLAVDGWMAQAGAHDIVTITTNPYEGQTFAFLVAALCGTELSVMASAAIDAGSILTGVANGAASAPVHDKDGVLDLTAWPGRKADATAGQAGAVVDHRHQLGASGQVSVSGATGAPIAPLPA